MVFERDRVRAQAAERGQVLLDLDQPQLAAPAFAVEPREIRDHAAAAAILRAEHPGHRIAGPELEQTEARHRAAELLGHAHDPRQHLHEGAVAAAGEHGRVAAFHDYARDVFALVEAARDEQVTALHDL